MNLDAVAKKARVSTATVSRVLNNTGPVREATRSRVLKAVQTLRYHPNLHARTLAGGKSRTLGIIVSNMENPFFFDIFKAAELRAHENGLELIVANTGYRPDRLESSIRLMMGRRVAGLALIVSESNPAIVDELLASRIPVMFYDVGTAKQNISKVKVDYADGVEQAVQHLYDLGHRRFGFVGHHAKLAPLRVRERTFRRVIDKLRAGTCGEILHAIEPGSDSPEGGMHAAVELFASEVKPTAIVCVNDFMALGVLRAARERGLHVPSDLSVVGFDNISLSEFCTPPLTTLHIPRDTIGNLIFDTLTVITKPSQPAQEFVVTPKLILRGSTAPPHGEK